MADNQRRLVEGKVYIDDDKDVYKLLKVILDGTGLEGTHYKCFFYLFGGEWEGREDIFQEEVFLDCNPREVDETFLRNIKALYGNPRDISET